MLALGNIRKDFTEEVITELGFEGGIGIPWFKKKCLIILEKQPEIFIDK